MNWIPIWICKCGRKYFNARLDRFTSFGFHFLCPDCGEDIGSHGKHNQIDLKIGRFVEKRKPFKLFKFDTWFSERVLEFKDNY